MNKLQKIVSVLIILLIPSYGIAQNENLTGSTYFSNYTVLIEIGKKEYFLDKEIHIKFITNFKEDSLHYPNFEGFKIRVGPVTTNYTITKADGEIERKKTMQYILKPSVIGEYIIESPVFFVEGKKIKESLIITVLDIPQTKKGGKRGKSNNPIDKATLLTYKFVSLYYETPINNHEGEKISVRLYIDSTKNSKIILKDEISNKTKTYKSTIDKKDYERLIRILSSRDIRDYPDENDMTNASKCTKKLIIIN